jgi:hypothetical protein
VGSPISKTKPDAAKTQLKRDLRRLFRSMDFVSKHPALKNEGPEANRFAEIYQQLGVAWEFLALQCKHWDGFRKTRGGRAKCPICGTFEDVSEHWVLRERAVGKRSRT